jgi:D-inositol-3-phosphate glycosyltransferase
MFPTESVTRVEVMVDGQLLGAARLALPRPDVAAACGGPNAADSGWEYQLPATGVAVNGPVTLGGIVYGSAGRTLALPSVTIHMDWEPEAACPGAVIDEPAADTTVDRLPMRVRGWAMFPTESVTRVEVTVDGRPVGLARIGLPRRDVAEVCGCADAPISGWEHELVAEGGFDLSGRVTLGGTAHGSAGGTVPFASVSVNIATETHALRVDDDVARLVLSRGREDRLFAPRARWQPPTAVDRPNILVFTHSLTYGGAQLYLTELLERLSRQGLQFTVISPADGPLRERLQRAGATVHLSPMPIPWQQRMYDARVAELGAFAAQGSFDLVIVNTISVLYGLDVAARLDLPSILAVHESFDLGAFWARHLEPHDPAVFDRLHSAFASASTVVFEAAATRALFLPYADPERLVTMPYGIDLGAIDRFRLDVARSGARSALQIDPDQRLVLCLGTIEPRKSQASLARAFSRVAERCPDAMLALVGRSGEAWTAPYVDGIAEYLKRTGMTDRVMITPLTSNPFAWHAAADVLVCASDVESLPRVVLEAMAFGTFVVATDVFGIPEVVEDRVTGFLCRSRDEQELADKLSHALTMRPDDKIPAAAEARVRQRHDADVYALGFRDLIDALMSEPRAAGSVVV